MRAITVWQPYASLIAEGVKTIETRGLPYPWRSAVGETIAIHAAKTARPWLRLNEPSLMSERVEVQAVLAAFPGVMDPGGRTWRSDYVDRDAIRFGYDGFAMPLGAVVATCRLVDVLPITESWAETECVTLCSYIDGKPPALAIRRGLDGEDITFVNDQEPYGGFAPGRYALLLDEVQKVAPVPYRGRQGLWTLPPEVADNLLGWAA